MRRKAIVGLVALTVLVSVGLATATQIDNEYVYAISRALFQNYTFAQLDNFHEQDVIQAAHQLGFDRELTDAEVVKLLCIIGAIEMPYVSPLWRDDATPVTTAQPKPPRVTTGKVDGSNAFDLVWNNVGGTADSAEFAISDIATTGPSNDLDNDGKPEIVVTCKNVSNNSIAYVVVFEQTADNTFAQVWWHNFAANYPKADTAHTRATRVELGDLDGDGDLDIICGVRCVVTAKTDFGCVRVFAWDEVNGSDNYGTAPATTYNLGITGSQWATAMAVGYIDEDPALELIVAENVLNKAYMLDITGTLGGAVTWNQEYCDEFTSGSPYAATVGDCDADGQMEFYITRWNWIQFHTYEWDSVGDSIIHYGYIRLEPIDDYSWEGTKVANFDGDTYSEVYITSTVGDLWVMTNTGDVGAADSNKVHKSGRALFGAVVGDQDHGPGSDGGDIYVCVDGGDIVDYEYVGGGGGVTDLNAYDLYTIFQDPNSISPLMVGMGDSLDRDGEHEVVVGNAEAIRNPSLFVLEHGEFAVHDIGISAVYPDYTTVGASEMMATVRNFGANDESGFNVHWSTNTGDSGTEPFVGTLVAQTTQDVSIPWTADTTGLVTIKAYTDLGTDENALNDTTYKTIYVYPPETAQYTFVDSIESYYLYRIRGVGVWGNDDLVAGINAVGIEFYHNFPAAPDFADTQWVGADSTIDMWYNWGVAVDSDLNAYLCNQYPDSTSQILVWDYNGNAIDFLALGYSDKGMTKGTTYPTDIDVDGNGYVYVAWYIEDGTVHDQIEVYAPMATWVDHVGAKQCGFEPGAYVVEGLCVNGDGTVIWVTDRSAPGSLGDVTRWTGSPAGGYTQDMTFAGDGTLNIPGYVRGIDLSPDGDIYVCSDANATFDQEKIFIADGTTGEMKYTIDIDAPGGYHASPYDIDFSLVGEINNLTVQKSADDAHLSWSAPTTATALYVAHQYGWIVAKWEGPGFKGVTSYDVHRDTVPEFIPVPATLLDNTANTFYTDTTAAVGNTGLNHYYIVKSKGTPGYAGARTAVSGEFDKDLSAAKKMGTEDRTTAQRVSR